MAKRRKQLDTQELARSILDQVVPDAEPEPTVVPETNPAAVALGRLRGRKGGNARAEKLTANQRKDIAKAAAKKRWD